METDFLPRHPSARAQVLRARQIVRENNDFISQLKLENQVVLDSEEEGFFWEDSDPETFVPPELLEFNSEETRRPDNFSDFFREIFTV